MSEESPTEQISHNSGVGDRIIDRLPALSAAWDSWARSIHQNRENENSGFYRTYGFLCQLVTEFVLYLILGIILATLALVAHRYTPFSLMIPSVWVAFPIYVGGVVTLCFTTSWDDWLRPN